MDSISDMSTRPESGFFNNNDWRSTMTWFSKLIGVVASVFLLAGFSLAETPNEREERPIRVTSFVDVLGAHFADGDNWTTEFIFMNMGGMRMPAELRFFDSKGQKQDVSIEGLGRVSSAKFTLNPYASARLRTVGGSGPRHPRIRNFGARGFHRSQNRRDCHFSTKATRNPHLRGLRAVRPRVRKKSLLPLRSPQ